MSLEHNKNWCSDTQNLKRTACLHLKIDGWKTSIRLPFGYKACFEGLLLLVSRRVTILKGSNLMQMYGKFQQFPLFGALLGLVSYNDTRHKLPHNFPGFEPIIFYLVIFISFGGLMIQVFFPMVWSHCHQLEIHDHQPHHFTRSWKSCWTYANYQLQIHDESSFFGPLRK